MNIRHLLLPCCLFLTSAISVQAQSRKEKARIQKEKETREKAVKDSIAKLTPYQRLLANPQKVAKGLMNLYSIKSKLYLEVPMALMGKQLLLASTISGISDNFDGIVGSKPTPIQVQFSLQDSSLLLRKTEVNTIAPAQDHNIRQALDRNSIAAIIKIFPVQAFNADKSTAVIDVTDYFIGDTKDLSPFNIFSIYGAYGYKSTQTFKRDRSYLADIKSFSDNVMIKSSLSYETSLSDGKRTVAKDRPFTAVVTRTFLLLPDMPARPRIADERIGIFTTRKKFISDAGNKVDDCYFANRFRLEPKEPAAYANGQLTEPVKPIIFYIDPDFPASWKPAIKAAVTDWQATFEKIGFKNAILAWDYPVNDSTFDPDNLKFNCIRYSPTPVANAMGPSWVDPRSGEIINASVYVFHDVVKLLNNWIFVQTAAADKNVRQVTLPDNYRNDGLQYVLRHEIGHCLGFMHNMGASASIPVDSLRSPSFTQQYGTTYSIMDYARFNYVAQPGDKERGVQLTPPKFGIYDYYLVDFNYRYFSNSVSPEKERADLEKLVSEKVADPRYRYGAQGMDIDPRSQTEDLGDDAVKASLYGINNLKLIMKELNIWVGAQDKDYTYRKAIWNNVLSQYIRYVNHVLKNIGGICVNEKHVGDPMPLFQSVPRAKQQQALNFLLNELKELDWLEDRKVLENFTLTGTPTTVLRAQIMEALLFTPISVNLSAIRSTEKNPLTSKEVMKQLYQYTWNKTQQNKTLSNAEKEIQKAFVKSMLKESKLVAPVKATTTGFSGEAKERISIQLPGLPGAHTLGCDHTPALQHPRNVQEFAGAFGGFTVNFNRAPSLESQYYMQLVQCKKLLNIAAVKTADQETRMHYRLLLHQIEKALK
ncbi:zinc-dependent metalloprotease [Pseudoflavitalea rhizosphaerae]|uniref:zinc-dependent metalloprotease n=1 Tax=Pseudoflavitalea rhizosphaerae TaxID=1884793 RepID=UPI000F8DF4E8|nr:zinc-dependent metalloprotease [Pseudoflavitalea rhizosphaerae]